MLKVGEFSRIGHVTVRALRLYDELGLLRPAATDRQTGYRYYTLEQLPVLNRILALKELGFGLDQIKRLLQRGLSAAELRGILLAKQMEAEREMEAARMRLARVSLRLQQIDREGEPPALDVTIKAVPAFVMATIRNLVPTVDRVGEHCDRHFARLHRWMEEASVQPAGPTANFYHMEEYRETDLEMESGVPLVREPRQPLPEGIALRHVPAEPAMASLVQAASFAELPLHVTALLTWADLNGYTTTGPLREIHLFGNPRTVGPTEPVMMELQVPVRPRV